MKMTMNRLNKIFQSKEEESGETVCRVRETMQT